MLQLLHKEREGEGERERERKRERERERKGCKNEFARKERGVGYLEVDSLHTDVPRERVATVEIPRHGNQHVKNCHHVFGVNRCNQTW